MGFINVDVFPVVPCVARGISARVSMAARRGGKAGPRARLRSRWRNWQLHRVDGRRQSGCTLQGCATMLKSFPPRGVVCLEFFGSGMLCCCGCVEAPLTASNVTRETFPFLGLACSWLVVTVSETTMSRRARP
ncbi:hypothetical protein TRVL_07805 [Trypanosoma vivax]|nr:hypothetical protein TRVL_07805 [Trypanosoma vivax]